MQRRTWRRLRKDLSILTSLMLLGLVAVAALTGTGMDDYAEAALPVGDIHAATGYAMALVAGAHALLNLGALRTYFTRRARGVTGARNDSVNESTKGGTNEMPSL